MDLRVGAFVTDTREREESPSWTHSSLFVYCLGYQTNSGVKEPREERELIKCETQQQKELDVCSRS